MSRAGQAWGIPLPFAPANVVYVWFDALINYASAVGLRDRRRTIRAVVARRPSHHREGHHAVPHRGVAGDAVERRRRGATAGVRPRLDQLRRPADEQDVGHERRPGGSGRQVRAGSGAAVSHQGDRVRQRRRFHVGAVRGTLQRRPGEQPRQPGEPRQRDGAQVPRRNCQAGRERRAARPGCHRCVGALPRGHGAAGTSRGRGRGVRHRDRFQRLCSRNGAMGARQGSASRRAPGRRPVRGRRGRAGRLDAAAPGDPHVGGRVAAAPG